MDRITSLLVARFILDLRQEYVANIDSEDDSMSLHIADMSDLGVKSRKVVLDVTAPNDGGRSDMPVLPY